MCEVITVSHKLILDAVKEMPQHYQNLFESWRIFMGMENAYLRVKENMRADKALCGGCYGNA